MSKSIGRHRAPRTPRAATLSDAFLQAGRPVAKVSAVLAVSGGLVATVAAPSLASPPVVAPPAAAAPAAAAPAAPAAPEGAASAVAVAAIARVGAVTPTFGRVGFTGVKARPRVAVAPAVQREAAPERASRTQQRRPAAQREQAPAPRVREVTAAPKPAPRPKPRPTVEAPKPQPNPAPKPQPNPAPAPSHSGVLAIAAQYTGIMYRYGGATPAGFDCSGYTSYVFAKVGISLPRSAAAQQSATTRVSSPQPGDLVFMGYPAHHVGIYAGNGMMYDSGRPGLPTQLRRVFHSSGPVSYGRA